MADKRLKILFVGNRFTSNMDVFKNPEYRIYKIKNGLEHNNIETRVILVDYKTSNFRLASNTDGDVFVVGFKSIYFFKNRRFIRSLVEDYKPDYIWLSNGPIVSWVFSKFYDVSKNKIIYEVLDNYKTYYPKSLWFIAISEARIKNNSELCLYVTKSLLENDVGGGKKKALFTNGVDAKVFKKMDMSICREKIGVPDDVKIIGYTGSIDSRVLDNLICLLNDPQLEGYKFLVATNSELKQIPEKGNVIFSGSLPMEDVPVAINCCDLMIIPNRNDDFTKYCYPSKLMEYIGCERPVLSTPFSAACDVLDEGSLSSFNMEQFALDIKEKLESVKTAPSHRKVSWDEQLEKLIGDL